MIPRQISIIFTYKCNFFCDHCSMMASPSENMVFDFSLFKKIIDEAREIPSIYTIVFTGGEPTLYFKKLLRFVNYSYESGFNTRLITNAWWAYSYSSALSTVRELRKSGLREINISFDDFHYYWLKKYYKGEENLVNAVKASLEEELRTLIAITRYSSSQKITKDYVANLLKKEGIDPREVMISEGYISKIGRALNVRTTFNRDDLNILRNEIKKQCTEIGTTITIMPDGRTLACCGHIIRTRAADLFQVGNVYNDSLHEIIKRLWRNIFFWTIYLKGPYYVLKNILEINDSIEDNFISKCEICYLLGTKFKSKLINYFSKNKYNIINSLKIYYEGRDNE